MFKLETFLIPFKNIYLNKYFLFFVENLLYLHKPLRCLLFGLVPQKNIEKYLVI